MADSATPSGGDGAGKPAGDAGAMKPAGVDIDALVEAVAAKLDAKVAGMVTGAVKRNVASAFEGIDLDALKSGKGNDGTPKPADKKLSAEDVERAEMKRQLETLTKESQSYKARALRGGVAELVNKANVTPEAAELLIEKFAGIVQEDQSGALHIKDGDDTRPFDAYLTGFLKDRKGLLKASVREGSGAGAGSAWSEAAPKSKGELLYATVKDSRGKETRRPTPERRAAFIAAHGQAAYDALPL